MSGGSIRSEAPTPNQPTVSLKPSLLGKRRPKSGRRTVLPLEKTSPIIKSSIYELYSTRQTWVTRDQLAKKLGEQTWVREALFAAGITDSIQQDKRIGNNIDWFSAHYEDKGYGLEDEFDRDEIDGRCHAPTGKLIAVGTPITARPPHKTERARFGHSASTLGG
jgi:hypothetical protein